MSIRRILPLFLFGAAAPLFAQLQITSLSTNPAQVFAGDSFSLIVNGTSFCFGATVKFNNQNLPSNFNSANQLQAQIAPALTAGMSGTVPVQVVNPINTSGCTTLGQASNVLPYTIVQRNLTVLTASLPDGVLGTPYSQALQVSGGAPPYRYVNTGGLPPGLNLDAVTGILSGTPTTVGTFSFNVTFRDSLNSTLPGGGQSIVQLYSVNIISPLVIVTSTLPAGQVNQAYPPLGLEASGGATPYIWTLVSATTSGFALSPAGVLSGTPTQVGSFTIQVRVTDHTNLQTVKTLPIVIQSPPLQITTTALPSPVVGIAYSTTLTATGGTPPYTWSTNSALPSGFNLSPDGRLAGTAGQAGSFSLQVMVTDNNRRLASRTLPLVIQPPQLQITTSSLPSATVGTAYATTLAATGGTLPYAWTASSGMPAGLNLAPSGVLSGTATQAGSFSLQVVVMDNGGIQASRALTLVVQPAPQPVITTTALPAGVVGNGYSTALSATGGTLPYTWTSGALPPGLNLTAAGVLSGTPQSAGSFQISFTVRDAANQSAQAQLPLTIASALQITTSTIPAGTPGTAYAVQFLATGGVAPYAWSAPSGTPPGLAIDQASGILAGTPAQEGVYNVNVQVRDSANQVMMRQFSLVVGSALTISTSSLSGGQVGVPYADGILAVGGTLPYTFTISGGAVPGLFLNPTTGSLSGTPTLPGNFNLTVRVTDGLGLTATRSFSINIIVGFKIATDTLPGASLGSFYEQTFTATGGAAPYFWTLTGSALAGLTLNNTTGVLNGIPSQAGSFSFTIIASDSTGTQASKAFTLTINQGVLIAPDSLPGGSVGVSYAQRFIASGGAAPYTFQVTGNVPGLVLDSQTGQFNGTPTQAGSFDISIRVTDARNAQGTRNYTVTVMSGINITTTSLSDGVERSSYSQMLTASGGTPPYSWRISDGTLPDGLSLNASTGVVSGLPARAGTATFTVEVSDSTTQKLTRIFTLNILPAVAVQTAGTLAGGTVGNSYSAILTATGGTPPYSWRVTGGALPDGLTLNDQGQISGTPTTAGRSTATVMATDAANRSGTADIFITINPPLLRLTSAPLPAATVGADYQATAAATGGTPPYQWSLNGAPSELQIDPGSGVISGRLAAPGSFDFSIRVADTAGTNASQNVTLSVGLPPTPSLSISGLPAAGGAGQQFIPAVSIGSAYPIPISGELILTFAPAAGVDDPAIQFASGGRRVAFNIPAGQTQAVFNSASPGLQTGTVAGTITVTAALTASGSDVTPTPVPSQTLVIPRQAPVITGVRATRTTTGFDLSITAYATSREITSATIHLQTSGTVQGTDFTVNLTPVVSSWYQGSTSAQFGSLCSLLIPFTMSGTSGAVSGFSVTLTNSLGTSPAATATF